METDSAFWVSINKVSLNGLDERSVNRAWYEIENPIYLGQKRAAPTLALVKALRTAHDEGDNSVLRPTPKEELE